ncbi:MULTISPECIES: hypothetical protein [Paraclostridium]|uniref:Uncharacterized protein n=3 Tax=Paraclostridium TaxID=1849822 RepID=A0A0M3DFB8_9FIRM|nr:MULTISPECIES: hypothetical protein [Paraclostridium]KGJ49313.1 hypothetical protein KD33_10185 [Clostridium sp. NCR]MCU9809492.1 hypothetical protein [Paraclostridium sp. AKS46]MDV8112518.1 hypothetical protein [Bacillus sp. BAU-SS-2023]EQK44681.1 hypothetical protein C672_0345 [[Clostridium] bifermentans ATCC 638] [Paraclostridium bifermentans ATCC 638 = DSM 14991]EQK48175.1 hypothetical protein C671_0438 [[Clostridium] bifermentans ATCC 19299] [Paraclostridium bifermentans ATCC 19299]
MIKIGNLNLDTEFDYRIIREEDNDIDLFIDINYRSLDIDCGDSSIFFASRLQFPFVRSIILRFNKLNNLMTVHLMRDIDLFSAFANFEIDYSNSSISIKNDKEKVIFTKQAL